MRFAKTKAITFVVIEWHGHLHNSSDIAIAFLSILFRQLYITFKLSEVIYTVTSNTMVVLVKYFVQPVLGISVVVRA